MRSDFDPSRARKVALREGLATVAAGALMPFGFLRSRHQPLRRRELRTVVFVHGLGANRGVFYPLQGFLRAAGHSRQLAFNHRSGPSVEALALQLKRLVDSQVKGGRVDIVAHSLGGLIARFYLQQLGGDRRVDRLVTLATPHHGTHASAYVPSALVRQLAPESPFLLHLNALPPPAVDALSVVAANDIIVLPATSAAAPFGRVETLHGVGHNGVLLSPTVFRWIAGALALV